MKMQNSSHINSGSKERVDIASDDNRLQILLHEQRYQLTFDNISRNDDLLEVGVGPGIFSARIAPKVKSYHGIEYDGETAKKASLLVPNSESIVQGDAHELDYLANSFDTVVCLEVLEHLKDYQKSLNEIRRVLRPTGKLIASIPYSYRGNSNPPNPFHIYEPGEREFIKSLQNRFHFVDIYYQRYNETIPMTLARRLHIRKFVGLQGRYAALTEGSTNELANVVLDKNRQGWLLGLFAIAAHPR